MFQVVPVMIQISGTEHYIWLYKTIEIHRLQMGYSQSRERALRIPKAHVSVAGKAHSGMSCPRVFIHIWRISSRLTFWLSCERHLLNLSVHVAMRWPPIDVDSCEPAIVRGVDSVRNCRTARCLQTAGILDTDIIEYPLVLSDVDQIEKRVCG